MRFAFLTVYTIDGGATDHINHCLGKVYVSTQTWLDNTLPSPSNTLQCVTEGGEGTTPLYLQGRHTSVIVPLASDSPRLRATICSGLSGGVHKLKLRTVAFIQTNQPPVDVDVTWPCPRDSTAVLDIDAGLDGIAHAGFLVAVVYASGTSDFGNHIFGAAIPSGTTFDASQASYFNSSDPAFLYTAVTKIGRGTGSGGEFGGGYYNAIIPLKENGRFDARLCNGCTGTGNTVRLRALGWFPRNAVAVRKELHWTVSARTTLTEVDVGLDAVSGAGWAIAHVYVKTSQLACVHHAFGAQFPGCNLWDQPLASQLNGSPDNFMQCGAQVPTSSFVAVTYQNDAGDLPYGQHFSLIIPLKPNRRIDVLLAVSSDAISLPQFVKLRVMGYL
eukprot:TRINITY_DN11152_c0_g1_i2.p1 TRINITY_DN11152_c0_g1~~TRINITY_DN11152_c0_g1_i2.p1  ORF type:complete len:387 (+),score=47.01 TRINITY_DN11152_c0_g1_i2:363-1523(+)